MSDERVDVRLRFYDQDFAALRDTGQDGKGAEPVRQGCE